MCSKAHLMTSNGIVQVQLFIVTPPPQGVGYILFLLIVSKLWTISQSRGKTIAKCEIAVIVSDRGERASGVHISSVFIEL